MRSPGTTSRPRGFLRRPCVTDLLPLMRSPRLMLAAGADFTPVDVVEAFAEQARCERVTVDSRSLFGALRATQRAARATNGYGSRARAAATRAKTPAPRIGRPMDRMARKPSTVITTPDANSAKARRGAARATP